MKTLLVDQAAIHYGVSRRTIYNWINNCKLVFKVVNGSRRIIIEDSVKRRKWTRKK